jgi:hypothetical protein
MEMIFAGILRFGRQFFRGEKERRLDWGDDARGIKPVDLKK